jgi:cytochrome c oxidase cbb3-type subunit 3
MTSFKLLASSNAGARRIFLTAFAVSLAACTNKGGETMVPQAPPNQPSVQGTPISPLFPGGGTAPEEDALAAKYANDENAKAEGARLYDWYNCAGCHFHGAGGIGPSLGDNDWIYGGSMSQIYSTIYQGRPNGMPSWGGKLSTTEIWEIAAYVHNLPNVNDMGAKAGEPVPPLPAVRAEDTQMPEIPESPSATP